MAYDVAAIRNKLKKSMSGKFVDPDEFRPPKAESTTEPLKFRFYILPPIAAGDILKSGTVGPDQNMDQFFLSHANHWINDRPNPCPRVWDNETCEICQAGFDFLKAEKGEEQRKAIIDQWMPNTYYMVNIFFTNSKMNPEDLRGKVKFMNAPKTCFDIWTATLMKDDAGDPEDPGAYGVFFDESAAFMFQLEVIKHGRNNSYKTSKFIADGGVPSPMIKDADGNPATEKIAKLLRLRHNLFEKVEKPDREKIAKLARTMIDGDDLDDDGFDQDETVVAKDSKSKSSKVEEVKTKQEKAKSESANVVVEDDDDDDDALADEAPLDDDDDVVEKAKEVKKTKSKETDVVETDTASNDDDDEIDALLDQLEDDD